MSEKQSLPPSFSLILSLFVYLSTVSLSFPVSLSVSSLLSLCLYTSPPSLSLSLPIFLFFLVVSLSFSLSHSLFLIVPVFPFIVVSLFVYLPLNLYVFLSFFLFFLVLLTTLPLDQSECRAPQHEVYLANIWSATECCVWKQNLHPSEGAALILPVLL